MKPRRDLIVIAIGGNSLIRDNEHQKVSDQFEVTRETCRHVREIVEMGYNVVLTHGNGPQVGFILRRCELSQDELHMVPLDSIGADTQGSLGYMIQQSINNEFYRAGLTNRAATIVTQVRVDNNDPAFDNPTKPIGSFMDQQTAQKRVDQDGWNVREDSGRGWRRVVASPQPKEIIERDMIQKLVDSGYVVIACGGGGIPVVRKESGDLEGVPAVIDKDHASALLAARIDADYFIISTAVDRVYLNYGKPEQQGLKQMTVLEAHDHLEAGQFPDGSMGPKVRATMNFIIGGGKEAIITSPDLLVQALRGKAGTRIIAK